MNKWILVAALAVMASVQYAESKKLLKLAAAAAIIRGGPIIPIPIRYPVHVPHSHKVVKVPVHHPVPVKVPVHHHSHSVEKVPIPVHTHSVTEKHVPVPIHHESIGLDHGYGGFDFGGHGHEEHGYGGEMSDIGFGGHGW
ncbi:uncharacterized protein LOC100907632 [Galendromus occidentalis]|uniref:Uncharacterized protein LOC100907632 n=1 Tax=Galendromus occidentalis TaxID=34638 RepID=A0AAJ6VU79_9ACAR|nr:uncharacterized protein LOC100907632 [Galendromus occidentalis]